MSIAPVPYNTFVTSNQAFTGDGGPWSLSFGPRQDHTACISDKADYCDGYCLQCRVFPPGDVPTYTVTFSANISINMAQYGGNSKLDFTWLFWPLYCQTGVPSGTTSSIHSQIGGAGFDDAFPAVDFNAFDNGDHTWNPASRITHSGTTSVTGSNGDTAYLPLSIRFALSPIGNSQFLNYYIKGIGLQLKSSSQSNSPVTSSPSVSLNALSSPVSNSSSLSTSAPPSGSALSPAPRPELLSGSELSISGSPVPTSTISSSSPSTHTSTSVVAGVTVGVVVLTVFLILIFLFLRRRRKQQSMIAVSHTELSPMDKRMLDGTRDTRRWTALWSRISVQEPVTVRTIDACHATSSPIVVEDSAHSEKAVSITESRINLLDSPGWDANAVLRSHLDCRSAPGSSMNLPDLTIGGRADTFGAHTARSSSIFSGMPYDPSPVYRVDGVPLPEWMGPPPPSPGPALLKFVNENRDLIPESLKEKLLAAGYLPTDDPGNLTAEEWWRDYGVTRVEYLRLLGIYAKRNANPGLTD